MQDDDKDTTQGNPPEEDRGQEKLREEINKSIKTGRIYKESYQPDNDDLDKPPQGSGVPPKDSSKKDE